MPRSGPGSVTTLPLVMMLPLLGKAKPAMALSKVDLPQPDGPSKQTNWQSGMSRLMSFSATTSRSSLLKTLLTPVTMIWDALMSALQSAMPAQHVIVQTAHADVDGQTQQADGNHAGDDLVGPEVFPRFHDAEPEAVADRNHLRHDHHDEGGTDADTHTREDIRHGRRQHHPHEQRTLAGAEVARRAQVDAVDLAHAGDGVHQYREERAQRNQEQRRRIAQPEPQYRQGNIGNRRNRTDHLHSQIHQSVDALARSHQQTERQGQPGADQEPTTTRYRLSMA